MLVNWPAVRNAFVRLVQVLAPAALRAVSAWFVQVTPPYPVKPPPAAPSSREAPTPDVSVNVLPLAIVSEPVEVVIVSPSIDVAVATPSVGVVSDMLVAAMPLGSVVERLGMPVPPVTRTELLALASAAQLPPVA